MQTHRSELVSLVQELCDRSDILGSQLRRCHFQYNDPEPNFDKRKVKGLVCRLIKVKDQTYCMALEIAGGGKVKFKIHTNIHEIHSWCSICLKKIVLLL